MVFKRRNKRTWPQTVADTVYPKGGWSRALSYIIYRLHRLPDPPHKIARGVAAGVFVCFTPFFGFHFVLAGVLAWMMQGNMLAALLATFFGNPLTFPLIAAVSIEAGSWMLGVQGGIPLQQVFNGFSNASLELWQNFAAIFTDEPARWGRLGVFYRSVFLPYLVGGLVPGTLCGVAGYMLALPAVKAYQTRRVKKLQAQLKKRQAAAMKAAARAAVKAVKAD